MTRPKDPYRNYKFTVSISGFTRAGFKSVDGLSKEVNVIEYREGGDPSTMRKIPGQAQFENLTLTRGMSSDDDFNVWMNQVFDIQKGYNQAPNDDFRRTVIIKMWQKDGTLAKQWEARYCWPAKIEVDALEGDGDDVLYETIELAHEGLRLINKAVNQFAI